jgi:hypothetical protein
MAIGGKLAQDAEESQKRASFGRMIGLDSVEMPDDGYLLPQ